MINNPDKPYTGQRRVLKLVDRKDRDGVLNSRIYIYGTSDADKIRNELERLRDRWANACLQEVDLVIVDSKM